MLPQAPLYFKDVGEVATDRDAKLVERCELTSKFAQLRAGSDPI